MGALAYLCDDTRGDWGAVGTTVNFVPVSDKDQFLTHFDGPSAVGLLDKSHTECLKRVKAIQTFHRTKWDDIGYNTLVCPHGRLIEARGVTAVGAQCPGYNRSGIGSQLMVGGSEKATAIMLNRQRKFYDDLYQVRKETQRKMGHRDGVATSCPGDFHYAWVKGGMLYLPVDGPIVPPPVVKPPVVTPPNPPGPRHKFPLPSSRYSFARNDGSKYTVSGYFGRSFNGRLDRSWIQEFASQLSRRGWSIGKGKSYLRTDGNNGYFGPEYEALVKAFQRNRSALRGDVDGRIGPNTWNEAFFAKL